MSTITTIDHYLDQLLAELRVEPSRTRRILVEVEDHLREAIQREVATGATAEEAEARAIVRFGSPRLVARRFAAEDGRLLPPSLLLHLTLALGLLAGVGFTAIGVSGVLAAGLGTAFGKGFIAGDGPGVTYTAARCADFFEYHPGAADCAAAATAHHFDEVVGYRLDAGVLGALLLGASYVVRRRYRRLGGVRMLPATFIPTAGAALFGAAALFLLGMSTMQIVFGGAVGAGNLLTGGMVSLAVFAVYAATLLRTLPAREAM